MTRIVCHLKKSRMSKLFSLLMFMFFASCNNSKHETEIQLVKLKPEHKPLEFRRGEEMADPKNTLEVKIETLELDYVVFGCACAEWIKKEDLEKDNGRLNIEHYFFLEPANSKLQLPDEFDAFKNRIRVTGKFYKNKDYPKGMIKGEENVERAKVFRYNKIELTTK